MAISMDSTSRLDVLGHPLIKSMLINLSQTYAGIDEVADTFPLDFEIDRLVDDLLVRLNPAYVAMENLYALMSKLDFLHWAVESNGKHWNPLEQSFQSFCLEQKTALGVEEVLDEASPSLAAWLYNEDYLKVKPIDDLGVITMLKQWFNL